jgi:DNA (cytosine-5)-methyltransferase 1
MNFIETSRRQSMQRSMAKPALFTFFAGAGFLDLGFEQNDFDVVFVNEFHKPFLDAYKYSREKMGITKPMFGHLACDIADLLNGEEARSLQDYVCRARKSHGLVGFVGGPPCPDFSVGGKNKGKYGENGKLSKTYVDLICSQRPDFFIFENVKGLWRTQVHRAFYEELKAQLSRAGYILANKLVNAIEYGAPQDRDRIILVGVQKSVVGDKNPDAELQFPWNMNIEFPASILKSKDWPVRNMFQEHVKREKPIAVQASLTVQHWFDRNDVTAHENALDRFRPKAALPKFERIDEGDDSKKCFKRLHRWRYSPTAAYGNNEVHLHPYEARRISVAEALAIQSLPKEFVLPPGMTLTDKFKTIGNGVPFLLASGVARSLFHQLEIFCGQIVSEQPR